MAPSSGEQAHQMIGRGAMHRLQGNGALMTRSAPFCVSGQLAQPEGACAKNQRAACSWCSCRPSHKAMRTLTSKRLMRGMSVASR